MTRGLDKTWRKRRSNVARRIDIALKDTKRITKGGWKAVYDPEAATMTPPPVKAE